MYEVQVVRLPEDPVLEPSAEPLQVAIVNIERVTFHLVKASYYLQEIEESGRRIKDTVQENKKLCGMT